MNVNLLIGIGNCAIASSGDGIMSLTEESNFYVNVADLHTNDDLLELNMIPIISIEVGIWSLVTWL